MLTSRDQGSLKSMKSKFVFALAVHILAMTLVHVAHANDIPRTGEIPQAVPIFTARVNEMKLRAQSLQWLQNPTSALTRQRIQSILLLGLLKGNGLNEQEKMRWLDWSISRIDQLLTQTPETHLIHTRADLSNAIQKALPESMSIDDGILAESERMNDRPVILAFDATTETAAIESFQKINEMQSTLAEQAGFDRQSLMKLLSQLDFKTGLLNKGPNQSFKHQILQKVHAQLDVTLNEMLSIGEQVANSDLLSAPTASMREFFKVMIGEYFKRLPLDVRKQVLMNLSRKTEPLTPLLKFKTLVLHAGPQFQKLFQVYARQPGFDPSLKKVFKELEQDTLPIPWRVANKIIGAAPSGFRWVSIKDRPLGTGTMAQVHRAKIQPLAETEGSQNQIRDVVVRFLKPGIQSRAEEDGRILQEVAPIMDSNAMLIAANYPKLAPFLNELNKMAVNEQNMNLTIDAQKRASNVYESEAVLNFPSENAKPSFDAEFLIHVPKIIDAKNNPSIMIQEFVPGISFEDFAAKRPLAARIAIEELAKTWLKKSLLEDGFYHADLHQGNLRVTERPGAIVQLNILDFGMAGELSKSLQNRFLGFGIAAESQDPALISRLLWDLSIQTENQTDSRLLLETVTKETTRLKQTGEKWPFYEWIALATRIGMVFPSEFTSLNRGVILIVRALEDVGSKMQIGDYIRDYLKQHPGRAMQVISQNPSIKWSDWIRLGKGMIGTSKTPQNQNLKSEPTPVQELPVVSAVKKESDKKSVGGLEQIPIDRISAPISAQGGVKTKDAASIRCENLFKSAM